MKLTTVLFDLDGTLLPMDNEVFVKGYFKLLTAKMAPLGYEPKQLVNAIWAGTEAMVRNDGSRRNEEAFWERFAQIFGTNALSDKPVIDSFYTNEFLAAKDFCGFNSKAAETVRKVKELGLRVALATNPLFPAPATENRIRWAGLEPTDFELYTTYENSRCCKPNPDYYREVLQKLNVQPQECLMVGNDVGEDMIAASLGMKVFLLTDCLINKTDKPVEDYPHGSFAELLKLLEQEAAN